ncbi:MAG: hypothetical protein ABW061_04590 [Polyangiaceae bacterium]
MRAFWGSAGIALFASALASGCSDSDLTPGGSAAGSSASAGKPEAGSADPGFEGESGAAGEPAMAGAAGATPPSAAGAAGAAGEGGEQDCGPHRAGPGCAFSKIRALNIFLDFKSTRADALSGDGKYVTTVSQNDAQTPSVAHRVSVSTGLADTLNPPQASTCFSTAMNEDASWIAGLCQEGVVMRPFYWTETSGAAYFDPALNIKAVRGISADAKVLFGLRQRTLTVDDASGGSGGSEDTPADFENLFRWGADGTFLEGSVSPKSGDSQFWSNGVFANRDGSLAIINAPGAAEEPMVYRWSAQNELQPMTIGQSQNYYDEYFATDVARDRDITIGVSDWCEERGCVYNALLWNRTRVASYIQGGTRANACNRDCSVVAGDVTNELDESGPGLWTNLKPPDSKHRVYGEAHLLIELLGVTTDLDGWSLGEIVALSDDGKVVAGNGTLNGKATAWVIHL